MSDPISFDFKKLVAFNSKLQEQATGTLSLTLDLAESTAKGSLSLSGSINTEQPNMSGLAGYTTGGMFVTVLLNPADGDDGYNLVLFLMLSDKTPDKPWLSGLVESGSGSPANLIDAGAH